MIQTKYKAEFFLKLNSEWNVMLNSIPAPGPVTQSTVVMTLCHNSLVIWHIQHSFFNTIVFNSIVGLKYWSKILWITGIVPVICLILLNTNIYRNIHRLKCSLKNKEGMKMRKTVERRLAHEKRELSLAVVLSLTVLMFLLTHTPRWVNVGVYFHKYNNSNKIQVLLNIYIASIASHILCRKKLCEVSEIMEKFNNSPL